MLLDDEVCLAKPADLLRRPSDPRRVVAEAPSRRRMYSLVASSRESKIFLQSNRLTIRLYGDYNTKHLGSSLLQSHAPPPNLAHPPTQVR